MLPEFEKVFLRLQKDPSGYSKAFAIKSDGKGYYCLQGVVGPATLQAWGGEMKKPVMPVAWVEIGKAYVSFHLMGMYENTTLYNSMSKELKSHIREKPVSILKT